MPSKIFLSLLIAAMFVSCKQKVDIDDKYLNDIAKSTTTVEVENPQITNTVIVIATNNTSVISNPEPEPIPKPVAPPKPAPKKKPAPKPRPFYSPWTQDTLNNDHKIIKDVRLLIAQRNYKKAATVINSVNPMNPPSGLDLGHLYQFKGIVYYFLSASNPSNISIAADSFSRVMNSTSIEKFKQLSLLWEGMLYETYSNNPNDLNKAITLFDKIINEYAGSRFIADAVYYKARVLRKLGKNDEANILITNLRNNAYPEDTDIYSHVYNDYVSIPKVLESDR